MTPQFSIITPSLNQGAYLQRALQSVAEQRDVSVEHVAYDPGSWDGSRALLRAWAEGGQGRRLFLERDAGAAEALNNGIDSAHGDLIGWLCSDDVYASPTALAAVQAVAAAHPECDIFYGRSALIDANGAEIGRGPFQVDPVGISQTLRAREAFVQPAAFVRRSLFERIGPLDGRYGLAFDVEFWLRAAASGAKFHSVDAELAHKRVHLEAASQLLPGLRAMDCARAVRAHRGAAGQVWIAEAMKADVTAPSSARIQAAAAAKRRFDRKGVDADLLVILGNGPSLADFDFEQLRGVDAIGMNAAYRHWRRIDWYPRYYACLDLIVGLSHAAEIERLVLEADDVGIDAFLLRDKLIETFGAAARSSPRVLSFDALAAPGGLLDLMPITTGSHAALFGALLGYRKLILLGIDCDYVEHIDGSRAREGMELEMVATPQENPNYYFADYQQRGDRYTLPNPHPGLHLECWRAAGVRLRNRDVRVFNAGMTSRLDAFARRPFSKLRAAAA